MNKFKVGDKIISESRNTTAEILDVNLVGYSVLWDDGSGGEMHHPFVWMEKNYELDQAWKNEQKLKKHWD